MAIWAAAIFGHTMIISLGAAAARPSRSTSNWARSSVCVPVFALPTTMPVRSGSSRSRPASASAEVTAPPACLANGSMPSSLPAIQPGGSNSSTGAQNSNRSGSPAVHGVSRIPRSPAISRSTSSAGVQPSGDTTPMPVTATSRAMATPIRPHLPSPARSAQ